MFIVYGFQKHEKVHRKIEAKNLVIYDAAKAEGVPNGFGVACVGDIVKIANPDWIWVYNDAYVVSNFLNEIMKHKFPETKVAVYIDQVYEHTKPHYVNLLNNAVNHVFCFTESWEKEIKTQGLKLPTSVMHHGIESKTMDKNTARGQIGLPQEAFLILNLNRNQPRKRWDICLASFVEFMKTKPERQTFLVIGTANEGAWNLKQLFADIASREGLQFGYDPLVFVKDPQSLSDDHITTLYNATDIGMNTCDGEGYGMCNIEHACVGRPQVVSAVGGLKSILSGLEGHFLVEPTMYYYVDNTRDAIGGRAALVNPTDVAKALEKAYHYGKDADIPKTHSWDYMASHLVESLNLG
jgi:glycogen synthase